MPIRGVVVPLAAAISATVAGGAWAGRALTTGGAIAAWAIGTTILVGTGWKGGAVLATFFATSTTLARLAAAHRPSKGDAKGERRDARQVYANGGVAALGTLLAPLAPALAFWVVTAALAAAAADTWATAGGALSRRRPRLLGFGASVRRCHGEPTGVCLPPEPWRVL